MAISDSRHDPQGRPVRVPAGGVALEGDLVVPQGALGVVLFAHGSGSSRFSRRNRFVASELNAGGLATLLVDLLTPDLRDPSRTVASLGSFNAIGGPMPDRTPKQAPKVMGQPGARLRTDKEDLPSTPIPGKTSTRRRGPDPAPDDVGVAREAGESADRTEAEREAAEDMKRNR
jgi:hypothetical protein